jgi:hypothetical protein
MEKYAKKLKDISILWSDIKNIGTNAGYKIFSDQSFEDSVLYFFKDKKNHEYSFRSEPDNEEDAWFMLAGHLINTAACGVNDLPNFIFSKDTVFEDKLKAIKGVFASKGFTKELFGIKFTKSSYQGFDVGDILIPKDEPERSRKIVGFSFDGYSNLYFNYVTIGSDFEYSINKKNLSKWIKKSKADHIKVEDKNIKENQDDKVIPDVQL